MKKPQNPLAFSSTERLITADQLVIGHTTIRQDHRAPSFHPSARSEGQARTEDERIEQITFLTQELRDGTIVVRTGKRRDEIDVAVRAPLEKATARNLDHNIKLDRR